MTLAILLFFSFLAGFVDSVVGGGGLIQLPALLLAFPSESVGLLFGTNKFAAASGTAVATVRYVRRVPIPWKLTIPATIGALIASPIGAHVVSIFDKELVRPIVFGLLVVVFAYTIVRKDLGANQNDTPLIKKSFLTLGALGMGLVIGFYDGFFGPGTGSFLIFGYVCLFGLHFLGASAATKIVNLTTNVSALAYFAITNQINFEVGIPMALANIAGNYWGSHLAISKGNSFIRALFLVVVSFLIVKLGIELIT